MTLLWIVSAASLLATWLNIRGVRACFAIWAITNAVWASIDYVVGIYPQAALHAVYCALALYGFHHWGKRVDPDWSSAT
ncbi:MAG: nicotinamide mononucleotide transporter [Planctomycetes bacterium]|nr:nicotinamide mononucleotide transporter [Planctomycetota bacterium]MBK9386503.1 nicotinamide mononucleotide transporter [Planctomycetota bacterium]